MANMTFKTNLLPNTDLGYSLGSNDYKWNIHGELTGNASTATALSTTGTTAQFYRGDNTWSNTLTGPLYINSNEDVGLNQDGALIVGNKTATNIAIDCDEIMARNNGAATTLYLNYNGGDVDIRSSLHITKASETGVEVDNTQTTNPHKGLFGVGNSGNLGIYDRTYNKWVVASNPSGEVYLLGNADSATALKDKTNGGLSYLNYGASAVTADNITWLCAWDGTREVKAISKTEMANAVDSAHKWVRTTGDTMTGQLYIHIDQDVGLNSNGSLVVGNKDGINVSIDGNEIMARTNGAASNLYINNEGGQIITGAPIRINGTDNSSTDARLYIDHESNNDWGIIVQKGSSYTYGINVTGSSSGANGIKCSGRITGTTVYGAVWNDYAEYRKTCNAKPGQCVVEIPNGELKISNKRCLPAARVISDTFGFAIGETEECQTPIAVSGRVLVYIDNSNIKIGDAVCSGKNGTVSKMHWYERILYPERIVGVVSEIPDYDEWLAGERDGNHKIKVDGRIWIYVK